MGKSTRVASNPASGPSSRVLRSGMLVLIFVFYATLLVFQPTLPVADDMPRHLKNGELILSGQWSVLYENVYSYMDAGHPFVNHHWLSGVVFYLFYLVGGWTGLTVLKTITYLAAFGLVFLAALRRADFWVVAAFSIPAILIMAERMGLRPEMWSYLFIALTIYLLTDLDDHPERRHVYWLIPLQLLWVNMHIFFSIGPMMVGAYVFAKAVQNPKRFYADPLVRKMTLILISMVAVSFINPHGAAGVFYRYPSDFPVLISENQSIARFERLGVPSEDVSVMLYAPLVAILGVSVLYGLLRRRLPLFYLFGSAATAFLGFTILRGIYFFGFFFLLTMSAVWSPTFLATRAFLLKRLPELRHWFGFVCAVLFAGTLIFLSLPSNTQHISQYAYRGIGLAPRSLDAGHFLLENDIRGPIFNDADIGSYLIYFLYPRERVFVDNLFGDAYSKEAFASYFNILADENAWQAALSRYQFNAIVFYPYDAQDDIRGFLYRRLNDPEWSLIYVDPFAMIYVRNTEQNRELIERYAITADNVAGRLASLRDAPDFDGMVAFADIANIIGRTDLGMETFEAILRKWPDKAKIWLTSAQWQMQMDTSPGAARIAETYLQRAILLGYKTSETYSFLGLAYVRMNDFTRAQEALETALRINPERRDARELLDQLMQLEASERAKP